MSGFFHIRNNLKMLFENEEDKIGFIKLFKYIHKKFYINYYIKNDEEYLYPCHFMTQLLYLSITKCYFTNCIINEEFLEYLAEKCIFSEENLNFEIYVEPHEILFGELLYTKSEIFARWLFILGYILFDCNIFRKEFSTFHHIYPVLLEKYNESKLREDLQGTRIMSIYFQLISYFYDGKNYPKSDFTIEKEQFKRITQLWYNCNESYYVRRTIAQCLCEISNVDVNSDFLLINRNSIFDFCDYNRADIKRILLYCFKNISYSKNVKNLNYNDEFLVKLLNKLGDSQWSKSNINLIQEILFVSFDRLMRNDVHKFFETIKYSELDWGK